MCIHEKMSASAKDCKPICEAQACEQPQQDQKSGDIEMRLSQTKTRA